MIKGYCWYMYLEQGAVVPKDSCMDGLYFGNNTTLGTVKLYHLLKDIKDRKLDEVCEEPDELTARDRMTTMCGEGMELNLIKTTLFSENDSNDIMVPHVIEVPQVIDDSQGNDEDNPQEDDTEPTEDDSDTTCEEDDSDTTCEEDEPVVPFLINCPRRTQAEKNLCVELHKQNLWNDGHEKIPVGSSICDFFKSAKRCELVPREEYKDCLEWTLTNYSLHYFNILKTVVACMLPDGRCMSGLTAKDCIESFYGYPQYDERICEAGIIKPCCTPEGTCYRITENACASLSGLWDSPCKHQEKCNYDPNGVCCLLNSGSIRNSYKQCASLGGTWMGLDTEVTVESVECESDQEVVHPNLNYFNTEDRVKTFKIESERAQTFIVNINSLNSSDPIMCEVFVFDHNSVFMFSSKLNYIHNMIQVDVTKDVYLKVFSLVDPIVEYYVRYKPKNYFLWEKFFIEPIYHDTQMEVDLVYDYISTPCAFPLRFSIVDGKLPPGLVMTEFGLIKGIPKILDTLPELKDFSASWNWFKELEECDNSAVSLGHPWKFTVRCEVTIADEEDNAFIEKDFTIRVHNDWSIRKEDMVDKLWSMKIPEANEVNIPPSTITKRNDLSHIKNDAVIKTIRINKPTTSTRLQSIPSTESKPLRIPPTPKDEELNIPSETNTDQEMLARRKDFLMNEKGSKGILEAIFAVSCDYMEIEL
jgi:hypothetical protein